MATIVVNSPSLRNVMWQSSSPVQQRLDMRTSGHFLGWRSGLYNPVLGVSTRMGTHPSVLQRTLRGPYQLLDGHYC